MRTETIAGLRVRITGGTDHAGEGDGPLCILLHGFGAPGDDLVPLWRGLDVLPGTRFAFPEAPIDLGAMYFGGRAWWHIDLSRYEQMARMGHANDRSAEVPEGLAEVRARVMELRRDLEQRLGAQPERVVLGGFSQGAMLACDVALADDRPLAGLAMLSGTFIAARQWTPRMALRKGLAVYMSHGESDQLLPIHYSEALRDELRLAGMDVTWMPFRGGHEIPLRVLEGLGGFVTRVTASPATPAAVRGS